MIHHIVQIEWKAGTTPEQIAAAEAGLRAMPSSIPEIRDIRFGPNLVEETVPYTHVLLVVVESMEALRTYIAHPAHKAVVVNLMRPFMQSRLAADVEVGAHPVPHGR